MVQVKSLDTPLHYSGPGTVVASKNYPAEYMSC